MFLYIGRIWEGWVRLGWEVGSAIYPSLLFGILTLGIGNGIGNEIRLGMGMGMIGDDRGKSWDVGSIACRLFSGLYA